MPRAVGGKVADAVQRTASPDDEQDAIAIVESPEGPRVEARNNRKAGGPRVNARPLNRGPKGPGKGPGKRPGGDKPFKGKKFAGKRKPDGKFGGKRNG